MKEDLKKCIEAGSVGPESDQGNYNRIAWSDPEPLHLGLGMRQIKSSVSLDEFFT